MRVLIVEDEREVADLLQRAVRQAAWAGDIARTGTEASEAMSVSEFDIVVLDAGLPDIDGFDLCRRWRTEGYRTPILILTARDALSDRVEGLDAGADDYLAKPFELDELLARLRALSRRPPATMDVTLAFEDLRLDTARREVRRAESRISLTAREYALLEYLLRNPDRVVSRGRILEKVWDDNFDPVGNVVDVLVGRLRRKLEAAGGPPLIHTIRGVGYVLSAAEPPDAP